MEDGASQNEDAGTHMHEERARRRGSLVAVRVDGQSVSDEETCPPLPFSFRRDTVGPGPGGGSSVQGRADLVQHPPQRSDE